MAIHELKAGRKPPWIASPAPRDDDALSDPDALRGSLFGRGMAGRWPRGRCMRSGKGAALARLAHGDAAGQVAHRDEAVLVEDPLEFLRTHPRPIRQQPTAASACGRRNPVRSTRFGPSRRAPLEAPDLAVQSLPFTGEPSTTNTWHPTRLAGVTGRFRIHHHRHTFVLRHFTGEFPRIKPPTRESCLESG